MAKLTMPNAENCSWADLDVAAQAAPTKQSHIRLMAMGALLLGISHAQVAALFRIYFKTPFCHSERMREISLFKPLAISRSSVGVIRKGFEMTGRQRRFGTHLSPGCRSIRMKGVFLTGTGPQVLQHQDQQVSVRVTRGRVYPDAAAVLPEAGPDLQELESQGVHLGGGQLGTLEVMPQQPKQAPPVPLGRRRSCRDAAPPSPRGAYPLRAAVTQR